MSPSLIKYAGGQCEPSLFYLGCCLFDGKHVVFGPSTRSSAGFFSFNLFPARAVYIRDADPQHLDVISHEQLVCTSFPFLSVKKLGSFPVVPRLQEMYKTADKVQVFNNSQNSASDAHRVNSSHDNSSQRPVWDQNHTFPAKFQVQIPSYHTAGQIRPDTHYYF